MGTIQYKLKEKHLPQKQKVLNLLGGDEEDRTLDLTDANRTLSQLSYAPARERL